MSEFLSTFSISLPEPLPNPLDAGQFIQHEGQMQLVHRVIAVDEERIVVAFDVPLDSPFHDIGGTPGWVGIEYMAQAIAVWSGYHARQRDPASNPRIGLLLGTRKYQSNVDLFPSGGTFHVFAERNFMSSEGLGQFHCVIRDVAGHDVLATAKVSVFEPGDAMALMGSVANVL